MAKIKKRFNVDKLLIILMIACSIYFIYSILLLGPIEKLIRYLLVAIIISIDILFFLKLTKKKRKKKAITIISLFFILFYLILGFNISKIYSIINEINKNYVTHSTSLITLKENNDTLKTITNKKIGLLNDKTSEDGYILPKEILTEHKLTTNNTILEYDNYISLANALYQKDVDFIFLPSNYKDLIKDTEGLESFSENTKTLISKEKEKEKELLGSSKSIEEPFTILLMGIDSTKDGLGNAESFNGDSLILVTFNPHTLNATMLSIPRDTYIPIACFDGQYENKITHAASKGSKCVIDTIQNYTKIPIDYYMKINFTGLVDLVNAVDGIEVNVPYSFCEQDSKRRFGSHTIYVEKGKQTLNGEEALALSRNRKSNANKCTSKWTKGTRNDFIRGQNQQLVIKGLMQKVKSLSSIEQVYEILDSISKNLDTNMETETILSFYNIAKDIITRSNNNQELITIEQLYLSGIGQTIYDERSKLQLWNYIPNEESKKDIIKAMKINLEIEEKELIKDFTYSLSEQYKTTPTGKGPYSKTTTYDLLPDLTQYTMINAQSWALKNNITLSFEYVPGINNNIILKQNYPENKRLDKIEDKTITLTVTRNY